MEMFIIWNMDYKETETLKENVEPYLTLSP
jgi:hypothetical protein